MRTFIQLALSAWFLALTAAPARADLIIYDMFGAVGAMLMDSGNPLISLGISEGDPVHLVVQVDYDASYGAGGFFGLAGTGQFADVLFDDIRAQEVVPEPATLLLLSSGLAGVVARRRRSRTHGRMQE